MVDWANEDDEVYTANQRIGLGTVLHLQVTSLGETGWDWHVWDSAGQVGQWFGLADTLGEAKGKAEGALAALEEQLGLPA